MAKKKKGINVRPGKLPLGVATVVVADVPPQPKLEESKESSEDMSVPNIVTTPVGTNIKLIVKPESNASYLEGYDAKKGWQRIYEIGSRGCCVLLSASKYEKFRLT